MPNSLRLQATTRDTLGVSATLSPFVLKEWSCVLAPLACEWDRENKG